LASWSIAVAIRKLALSSTKRCAIGKHNSLEVARAYDRSRFPVIADIGGGIAGLLVDILDAYPPCRGILVDEPKAQEATSHERLQPIGGDFFKTVPAGADAYILR
jgi:hypothetical protein